MRLTTTITLILALAASGIALKAPTALAGEEPELPHAFDAGWKGQKTCELLFTDDSMRVGRCVFPPGVGHEKHYHEPHFGYVLEGGTLRVMDSEGERIVTAESGGSWSTNEVTIHQAVNIGDTTASFLIMEPIEH